MRVLHPHRAALDAQDAPRGVAELEDVAGQALDGEVLVERAETGPVGLQHHVVVGVVGDGAAGGHRGEAGAAPGAQLAVDHVAVQVGGAAAPPGRESAREHREKLPPPVAIEVPVRPGAANRREQGVLAPVLRRHHGDRLLRQHVEGSDRHVQRIELTAPNRVQDRCALDQLVAGEREQPALRGAVHRVAGAAGALQEGRDGARGAELADEIDVADVDPELERRGGHQRLEVAGLQALLGREPALAREAAVVRGDVLLAERLGQRPGDALRHAARVDEHERGAVRLDEGAEPPVDLGPDLAGHHRLERRLGQLKREVALPGMTGVDDGAFARLAVVAPGEEVGDGLDGALGRRQPDAGDGPAGERVQAFEREREVGAPLVARDGVDLVDDRGADAREHGPPAFAREQDVERLRRRHQDVRRLPAHGLASRARGVAGAHHGPDTGTGLTCLVQRAVDAFERHLQVLVHVVAEGLERRDVEDPGRVGERGPAAVTDQGVDGGEKSGQGLAGARGRGDERMAAPGHRLPCLLLARGRCPEVRGEPGRDGGVESIQGHAGVMVEGALPAARSGIAREPDVFTPWLSIRADFTSMSQRKCRHVDVEG